MSQTYRVKLKNAVSRRVSADDSVSYPISLTDVLSHAEMKDLLRERLQEKGFEEVEGKPGQLKKKGSAGEDIVVDLDQMQVTATIVEEKEVSMEVQVEGVSESRKHAQQVAEQKLAEKSRAADRELRTRVSDEVQKKVTKRLEDSEEERMRLLNEVMQEVYADAVKQKARTLGDVVDVRESTSAEGQYQLDIRIET